MFKARFFNSQELDTSNSISTLGLYLSGIGLALCISSITLYAIPTGVTQGIASGGFLFGTSFLITGFALMAAGFILSLANLAMSILEAAKDQSKQDNEIEGSIGLAPHQH